MATSITSIRERLRLLVVACLLYAPLLGRAEDARSVTPHLGRPLTAAEVAAYDLTVFPDGTGLPAGHGTPAEGGALFAAHCALCHGVEGAGGTAVDLAGGRAPLDSDSPDKNVGNYWPYATTLFDFIRRAMPMTAPGSLTNDEVYALCAYILQRNGIVAEDAVLDARSLAAVQMPNRNGFISQWPENPARLEAALARARAAAAQHAAPAPAGADPFQGFE